MSLGYAEKLSYREDLGQVGMVEYFDSPGVLQRKIGRLASMIKKSKHFVAFTGAGVSTSSGIPDFRGPKGIWTQQKEGKALPESSVPFHRATPSIAHMGLVELEKAGILQFIVSQNIDGLHLRSGIPREKLSELHGNAFMEVCPCGAEYIRDFEVETIGMKETSRCCLKKNCKNNLRDTVLDWEDVLPTKEMNRAEKHCQMADVVLCLGTSLQITPACDLPLQCLRRGGKIVIVNLQKTPKDKKSSLVIHGLVDEVIGGVLDLLDLKIPPFIRIDLFEVALTPVLSSDERYINWTIRVSSVHGADAPLSFVECVEVKFSEHPDLNAVLEKDPYVLTRRVLRSDSLDAVLRFTFGAGCACAFSEVRALYGSKGCTEGSGMREAALQLLRDSSTSVEEDASGCGQSAVVERRRTLSSNGTDVSVHAIVTDVVRYQNPFNLRQSVLNKCRKRRRKW